jgi:hypothetical protein
VTVMEACVHLYDGACCQDGAWVLGVMQHGAAQVVKCTLVVTQPASSTTQLRCKDYNTHICIRVRTYPCAYREFIITLARAGSS